MIIPTVSPRKAPPSQFAYPAWPTSKPGPETTSPLSGQKPHPMRTDQMVYECYDQERGMPDVTPPTRVTRENGTRIYLPDAGLQEVDSEAEAMERWLDDGLAQSRVVVEEDRPPHVELLSSQF